MVTQNIKIIMDDRKLPEIRMVSGDVGRDIFPVVYPSENDEEALDLTVYQLRVIFIKPDNTFVIQDYLDGMIEIPEQAGAVTGRGFYQIRLSKDGEEIYSGQGDFYIDDYILNDSMVESIAQVNGRQFPDDFLTSADLSNYATKEYVDDEIANIDLSDYVTNEALEDIITYSTTPQLVGYWIDGRPIKRIVFTSETLKSIPANAWVYSGFFLPANAALITAVRLINNTSTCWNNVGAYIETTKELRLCNSRYAIAIDYNNAIVEYVES